MAAAVRRLALLLSFLPVSVFAQGVWGLRGITKHFAVRGNVVYTIDGRGVAAYDAATLTRLGAAETNAESLDGAFAGDTLTVLTTEGFERFTPDLARIGARPEAGTRLASNGPFIAVAEPGGVRVYFGEQVLAFSPQTGVRALAWRGNALIAATASSGIVILDGTTGAFLAPIGESALDIAVDGNFLYTASGHDGLAIYDITNPAAPQLVSRTAADEGFYTLVAAGGGRAVVADGSTAVRAFDVTTPAAPKAFPPIPQPAQALAMSGTRVFVSGSIFDDLGIEHGSGVPVRELEFTRADAPVVVGEATDLAGPVSGAATDGSLAFVVDPPFFRVLDVSTTAAPKEIASLRLDDIQPFVKSMGSRVLLYGNGKARYIDVGNPYRPRVVGTFDSTAVAHDAAAVAPNAFLEGNALSGFHVFDFLPDGSAHFIAGIKTHSVDIVANGDAVYYSVEFHNVGIANISNGANAVSAMVIPNGAIQLAMAGDLLLIRDPNTLHVYTTENPFAPVEVGALPLDRGGVIAGEPGAAWVAMDGTVIKVDLSNPANPLFRPAGWRVVAPSQIAATNGKVVVADRYGLRVFGPDTAAPAPPPPVGPLRRRASRP